MTGSNGQFPPRPRNNAEDADAACARALALHQGGQLEAARRIYDAILATKPDHADTLRYRGMIGIQTGDFTAAAEFLGKAVASNATHSAARSNLGVALRALGRLHDALASFRAASWIEPGNPIDHFNQGVVLHELGQSEEALARYNEALRLHPDYAEAYFNRGVVQQALGQDDAALASYDMAVARNPDNAEFHAKRAVLLIRLIRMEEAIAACDRAIALQPGAASFHTLRGTALNELRRYEDAMRDLRLAVAIDPDDADAHANLGIAQAPMQRPADALASFDRAIALRPSSVNFHFNRAVCLTDMQRYDEAIASLDTAIALEPENAALHAYKATALANADRPVEALNSFTAAKRIDPDGEKIFADWFNAKLLLCDWEGYDKNLELLNARIEARPDTISPFQMLRSIDSPRTQLLVTTQWADTEFPTAIARPAAIARTPGDRIRLGYFSPEFRDHAVPILMAGLVEAHDRAAFEVFGFSFGPDPQDAMRARLLVAFDHFIDVRGMSDDAIAMLAREKGIDIAIDLAGLTQFHRAGIFHARAAPVQVNYLGYPATTGAAFMDYIIADATVVPPASRQYYREKIACLPHTYQPNDRKRVISDHVVMRADVGLPPIGFVFCGFNNSAKFTPTVFRRWMNMLRAIPDSVLWLLESNPAAMTNLRQEAVRAGIDGARLIFAAKMPVAEHLARHRLADLYIDTLPYNAHTTASDALWAGLPVLTCMGQSFASRVAASLLHAIGLPELITESLDDYEALAIALAGDPARLGALRKKLANNRLTQPLFDTALYTHHIEAAFTTMHDRHCRSLPPETFVVAP